MVEEDWTRAGSGSGSGGGGPKIQFTTSAIQSGEDLNPVNLKALYALLLQQVSSPSSSKLLKQQEIHHLSHILFSEVDRRFNERVFSVLLPSHNSNVYVTLPLCPSQVTALLLLLRCCLLLLIFIASEQDLLLQKGRILLFILSRLFSISNHLLNPNREFVASINLSDSEPSHPFHEFLCALLEVFATELLTHKSLRHYFILIDAASPRNDMLFSSHFGHANIGCVLEILCAHFIVSLSHAQAFENFINRLFWRLKDNFKTPQISLSAILSLLLNPIILSAPKLFLAYLILLASEAIGISTPLESMRPDLSPMDYYTTTFERSFFFYTRHMGSLHVGHHPWVVNVTSGNSYFGSNDLVTFESLLQPATRDKLHHLISKSNNAWDSYLSNMLLGTNSDIVAASILYVKESLHNFDTSHKDEVLSILSSLALRASSDAASDSILHKMVEARPQDIYLLASILKLMGSSLLQSIWHIRSLQLSGCLKSLEDVFSSEEYGAIMDTVSCFEQFTLHLPIQKFLDEKMHSHPAIHKKSQWMLLHFSGLLSLSYAGGLDFLVKDCLFTLLTVLSLFNFEEGDLRALRSLLSSRSKSLTSKSSDNIEVLVIRKSSQIISPKIQKIHEAYLRTRSLASSEKQHEEAETSECTSVLNVMDSSTQMIETEKTCSGEVFLKSLLGQECKSSDLDDLADFIECSPGVNYTAWLRNRQRFRQWKNEKLSVLRLKKKRRAWKILKGR